MNINILLLGFFFEGRRNGNDIFSLQKLSCRNQIFLRFQRCFSRTEETLLKMNFQNFLFEAEAVSIEQIAVLVFLEKEKCRFKLMSRFAVVEFEDIDVTFS